MPFETIETQDPKNRMPVAKISYRRPATREGKKPKPGSRPSLMVSIPTTICGLAKRKKFVFALGSGPDAGKARIVGVAADHATGVPPSELKHAWVWRFGFVPYLGEDAAELEEMPVTKIDENTFEFSVPAWFKADKPVALRKAG